jgi:hypothetical protein
MISGHVILVFTVASNFVFVEGFLDPKHIAFVVQNNCPGYDLWYAGEEISLSGLFVDIA